MRLIKIQQRNTELFVIRMPCTVMHVVSLMRCMVSLCTRPTYSVAMTFRSGYRQCSELLQLNLLKDQYSMSLNLPICCPIGPENLKSPLGPWENSLWLWTLGQRLSA